MAEVAVSAEAASEEGEEVLVAGEEVAARVSVLVKRDEGPLTAVSQEGMGHNERAYHRLDW